MYKVKVEKFNGPLDLLLQLIEKKEMNITELALSEVTEQYLEHIERIEDDKQDPEELADFLFVAARLLLIKSKALLPTEDDEIEPDDLEKQLKMYKKFVEASREIENLVKQERFLYSREKAPQKMEVEFSPPANAGKATLKTTYLTVLKRLDPLVKIPRQAIAKTISLQQKVYYLKDFIIKNKKANFHDLIKQAPNKTEVIVSFLAILELVKQKHCVFNQDESFGKISVERKS